MIRSTTFFTNDDEMLVDCVNNVQESEEADMNEPIPSGSGYGRSHSQTRERSRTHTRSRTRSRSRSQLPELTAMQRADRMVCEAEEAKAKLFAPPGRSPANYSHRQGYRFTAEIDEDYSVIGRHVDAFIQQKIIKGEYVDFGKLIPKDKILSDEEGDRFELMTKNGKTFWSPISESVQISSFTRWEQAFRVFSSIYNKQYPHKSTELIQYNHIIHSISLMYIWDNVYAYDKDFRIHLSRHPDRPWNLILHQAWFLRLKDRLQSDSRGGFTPNSNRTRVEEPCHRFNRGKCNFDMTCKFDHRCSYCNKFGHSFVNCRKAMADRDRKNKREDYRFNRHDVYERKGGAPGGKQDKDDRFDRKSPNGKVKQ